MEEKLHEVQLSDADVVNMDDTTGDITVKFLDNVSVGDIVEIHFAEDTPGVVHRYRCTFVDGPDAVTSLEWIEMRDSQLVEANLFQKLKNAVKPDLQTRMDRAIKQGVAAQEKKDQAAQKWYVRDMREGKDYHFYIQLPNGSYITSALRYDDVKPFYANTNKLSPAIINAIVTTPDNYIVRAGKEDLSGKGQRYVGGPLKLAPSNSQSWDKQSIAEFRDLLKGLSTTDDLYKAVKAATKKHSTKTQKSKSSTTTTEEPIKVAKTLTPAVMDKFKTLVKETGLQIKDDDMKRIYNVENITPENASNYWIVVQGNEKPLLKWLQRAMELDILTESCDVQKIISEGLLYESPMLTLSDDDLMDPASIDFKKIGKQAADKEAAEAAQQEFEKQTANLRQQREPVLNKLKQGVHSGLPVFDIIHNVFDDIIPPQGAADSVAGELLRAIYRIRYRDYNDGDKFFTGYGLETCGSSASYLFDNGFAAEIQKILDDAYRLVDNDDAYTHAIELLAEKVVQTIINEPKLLWTPNTVDSREYKYDYISENQPRYEYELYGSDDIDILVNNGTLDAWDLKSYVEEIIENNHIYDGAEVAIPWSHDSTSITVTELTGDGYAELESTFTRNVDKFWEDLVNEHSDALADASDDYDDEYDG